MRRIIITPHLFSNKKPPGYAVYQTVKFDIIFSQKGAEFIKLNKHSIDKLLSVILVKQDECFTDTPLFLFV